MCKLKLIIGTHIAFKIEQNKIWQMTKDQFTITPSIHYLVELSVLFAQRSWPKTDYPRGEAHDLNIKNDDERCFCWIFAFCHVDRFKTKCKM